MVNSYFRCREMTDMEAEHAYPSNHPSFRTRWFCSDKQADRGLHNTARTLTWDSVFPRRAGRAQRALMVARNVFSPATSPSAGRSCLTWWPRCRHRGPRLYFKYQDYFHYIHKYSHFGKRRNDGFAQLTLHVHNADMATSPRCSGSQMVPFNRLMVAKVVSTRKQFQHYWN